MGSVSKSYQLVKESFAVLKSDKELVLFPIMTALLELLLIGSFLVPIYFLFFGGNYHNAYNPDFYKNQSFHQTSYYLGLFLFYLINYFIISFFYAGLISCAHVRLNGKNATFSDGIRDAFKHIVEIFIWALISATVGIIFKVVSDKSGLWGKLITSILGIAWSLLTFFVVPIIVLEDINIFSSIGESGKLFKRTWGENVVGQFSVGVYFMLLALIGLIPFSIGSYEIAMNSYYLAVVFITISILYWTALGIISSSLQGIFVAALYQYAKTGQIPSSYQAELVKEAFKEKSKNSNILTKEIPI